MKNIQLRKQRKKGFALIQLIIIIALLSLVGLGLSTYISESLRLNLSQINQDKALYMAQSGVMQAVADYPDDGLWTQARDVSAGGEFYYHLGKDANFLWVDASGPQISGKNLKRIPIKNISSSSSLTVKDLIVSWDFAGTITKVTLGSNTVWTGATASPANLDIMDFSIASAASHSASNDQIWQFSNSVSGNVLCTFIFSDGSSFKTHLLKNGAGANKEFSITATGEIKNGSSVEARRTLSVTYDTGTNRITSWQEAREHIIP